MKDKNDKQPELKGADMVNEALTAKERPAPEQPKNKGRIVIKENPGFIPVPELRKAFEQMCRSTTLMQEKPLAAVMKEGKFNGYANPVTDLIWVGFAFGARLQEKFNQSKKQ